MFEGLFRNTLSPMQWGLLALIPPAILALYFLKLRRVPVEVPSTYLWMRAIEDLHVNSLWQRLRKSLLLLLQLLLVGLAMLSLLRPGWQGQRPEGQRLIFLVDNSASMNTTDADAQDPAVTRLAASKAKISALVEQMERDMSAMIISFADRPRVVQEFTDNRRLLQERLETIQPSSARTDLLGALRLADGLANPGQVVVEEGLPDADVSEPTDTTLYLFTDGRFGEVQDFALGNLDPIYVSVGTKEAKNLAITSFNTRPNEARPKEREAFVQVSNFTGEAQRVVVELWLDGQFLDARAADVPDGGSSGYTFPLLDAPTGKLEARIEQAILDATGDQLSDDNVAYTPLNRRDPGRIMLITSGNLVVETALSTVRAGRLGGVEVVKPSVIETEQHQSLMLSGLYDLVIYDRCGPKSAEFMPRANTFFIGQLPPTAAWQGGKKVPDESPDQDATDTEANYVSVPQVIDWNRAHPLMSYVEISDLLIGKSLVLDPPAGAGELIDSTEGVLMAVASRDSFQDLVLGFPILIGDSRPNTKWYSSRSFPTFWLNVLDYMVAGDGDPSRGQASPGDPVEIRPSGGIEEIAVVDPAGKERILRRTGDGPIVFQETLQRGTYEVKEQGQVSQRFAVNLFDRGESDIALRPAVASGPEEQNIESLRIGYVDVAAASAGAPSRQELWRPLLWLVLIVLVAEWYLYNRRVYG